MKNKIHIYCIALLCFFPISCHFSGRTDLYSIQFPDDKTLEYQISYENDKFGLEYYVKWFEITPSDDYWITYQSKSVFGKHTTYFNKDIPDGSLVELHFMDEERNEVFSYSFVKDKELHKLH